MYHTELFRCLYICFIWRTAENIFIIIIIIIIIRKEILFIFQMVFLIFD